RPDGGAAPGPVVRAVVEGATAGDRVGAPAVGAGNRCALDRNDPLSVGVHGVADALVDGIRGGAVAAFGFDVDVDMVEVVGGLRPTVLHRTPAFCGTGDRPDALLPQDVVHP